ncbi:TPM domain-containing protein [Campylobacter sp.]|uniref:TPM domain-containing protein n=1 Tax=Campylobacter sp. TaxID=205 RepID=UPI003FA01E13
MKKIFSLLCFAFCFCFALNFNEQINDEAHLFSENERDELLNLVQNFEQNSTTQIAIVTLKSLENKSIEELSLEIARGYELGQKGSDNGVLLLVAPNEKKVRIEVGYGLEGILTDAVASHIISSKMIPEFKKGDMSHGVKQGVLAIIKAASGEEFVNANEDDEMSFGGSTFIIGMISCFLSILLGKFFRRIGFSLCFAGITSIALEEGFEVQDHFIIYTVFVIIFAVFFMIFKDAFKKSTKSESTYSGFRRDRSDSNSTNSSRSSSRSSGRSSSGRGGFGGGGGGFGGGGASGSW